MSGVVPNVHQSQTWTINKKVTYSQGFPLADPTHNAPFMYPNSNWLPFLCIYNPTFDTYIDGSTLEIRNNNAHWFTDS